MARGVVVTIAPETVDARNRRHCMLIALDRQAREENDGDFPTFKRRYADWLLRSMK